MKSSGDIVIIGAGVIGAAVAYALRERSADIYILEKEAGPARGQSSRCSGVIHAGLYYPSGSLKERLCRKGAARLYEFAMRNGVPYRMTGKYIVACNAEEQRHLQYLEIKNRGIVRLERRGPDEMPEGVQALGALFSPLTGLVDVYALINKMLELSSAEVLYNQNVEKIKKRDNGVTLIVNGEPVEAKTVINCAGFNAADFHPEVTHHPAKGSYFQVKVPAGVHPPALVYPAVPSNSPGLGIHLTQNLAGEVYLGPDLSWEDTVSYTVDPSRREAFYQAAVRFLPWLERDALTPAYAGIRPKISNKHWSDFRIEKRGDVIHCTGIESPGITAALAIGEMVANLL